LPDRRIAPVGLGESTNLYTKEMIMRTVDLLDQIRGAMARGDWPLVELLAPIMDAVELTERPPEASLLGAALWYAEQGLHVFPLTPYSKIPWPKSRGFKDATTDLDQIRAWWRLIPASNIGIATGHLVDVIDIDGPEGVMSWARTEPVPALGTVNTPRAGGTHLYIPATGGGNLARILPGVDMRGLGGYVVAPPSVNDQGRYSWRRPLDLAEAR
jgi:hypothetical protein